MAAAAAAPFLRRPSPPLPRSSVALGYLVPPSPSVAFCLLFIRASHRSRSELDSPTVVAVKQLDRNGLQGNREFLVEVLMLSLLHHSNLVNLIGYCADGDQRLLVYEFMPFGSLEDHLHGLYKLLLEYLAVKAT